MKKAFIICSVRNTTDEYKKKLEKFVEELESQGYQVHLPHRDTNQTATGFEICTQNCNAIKEADVDIIIMKRNSLKLFKFNMLGMINLFLN